MNSLTDEALISIIVPIYNAEQYLNIAIDSIINQTYKAIEIVLVDDGSADESGKICDDYAKRDKRIIVIHQENKGLVNARKTGLKTAGGSCIAFVDADDWIEPDMIERMYAVMTEQNVAVVLSGRYEDTGDISRRVIHGALPGRYNRQDLENKLFPNMIASGDFFEWGVFPGLWDKLWNRDALYKYEMEVDEYITMGEDAACVYPALLNADGIYIMDECFYHYRQIPTSMVKVVPNAELIRKRFNILYTSVDAELSKYDNRYKLREQWLDYVLFLMIPRAGELYSGIEKLDYLYPFPGVKAGSNVIIYGMGTYGQLLYRYLTRTGFCNVVACADRNNEELCKQGMTVIPPDKIYDYDYDAIVIAASFAKVRNAIYKDLITFLPSEKVHVFDEKLIKSRESLEAFGLV